MTGGGPAVHRTKGEPTWQGSIGSAGAVAFGDLVVVAGTTAWVDGAVREEGDPYGQTVEAFRLAVAALEPFGAGLEDVVRTRMYITHARDAEAVGRAHRDVFGDVRPAATVVGVSGLIDSRMLVEVEIEAYRPGRAGRTDQE